MKIQDSSIQMSSQHSLIKAYQKVENLNAWEDSGSSMPSQLKEFAEDLVKGDKLELSGEAQGFMEKKKELLKGIEEYTGKVLAVSKVANSIDYVVTTEDDLKLKILEDFLRSIFNRKIRFKSPRELNIQISEIIKPNSPGNFQNLNINSNTGSQLGWGFQYNFNESYLEREKTSFKSSGLIHTADGKEISFDIELNMNRTFYTETNLSVQAGDRPIDPLVVNFDGEATELTSTKFSFDLDSDGKEDQISSLKEGSGFLALDLNEDGIINDGGELFGPNSGDGFEDLARYDGDHNNWIDENDDVFDKLRIWTKDEDGNDKLFALGEKGIGAIYLGNIGTRFSMRDMENKSLAEVKNSGIFVKENGTVGTVQQVDFIV
ncbi:hypothetical protein [Clostridium sp. BJN0013]|uniref:hypothetical protein n=1 Tax=Clostridium sp. BJN0013 TaxID=3236840 RepID=UPI0034C62215